MLLRNLRNASKVPTFASIRQTHVSNATFSSPRELVDCVVIGAGVVGIAIARELALRGRQVLVVESGPTFGTGTSSRNSEVIHAGIYYPQDSLKAAFCGRGRDLMYKYCSEHQVPHKQIGKLIVATGPSEIPKLIDIMDQGVRNGVKGLKLMDGSEAMRMEPELECVKAVFSPFTGIVDSHSFMLSLLGEAESRGTIFSYNTVVLGGRADGNSMVLHTSDARSLESWNGQSLLQPELILVPKFVVNSAGLNSPLLAKRFQGIRTGAIPPAHFARGCYFTLSNIKKPPFTRLIYPIPEPGGIGVHVTLDLNGQVKFGPDVEWINGVDEISSFLNRYDYSVSESRRERFYTAVQKYYPNLKDGALEPGYAGIRPKLSGPQEPAVDFVVQGEEIHGVPGLVNLFGIESPGLTSSLAIAEHVVTRFLS